MYASITRDVLQVINNLVQVSLSNHIPLEFFFFCLSSPQWGLGLLPTHTKLSYLLLQLSAPSMAPPHYSSLPLILFAVCFQVSFYFFNTVSSRERSILVLISFHLFSCEHFSYHLYCLTTSYIALTIQVKREVRKRKIFRSQLITSKDRPYECILRHKTNDILDCLQLIVRAQVVLDDDSHLTNPAICQGMIFAMMSEHYFKKYDFHAEEIIQHRYVLIFNIVRNIQIQNQCQS